MRKGQTALEYLITYGWAILIILVVLAVLWYYDVFNPAKWAGEQEYCPADFELLGAEVSGAGSPGGTLKFVLGNKVGNQIVVDNITVAGDIAGTNTGLGLTLAPGAQTATPISVTITTDLSGYSAGDMVTATVGIEYMDNALNMTGSEVCDLRKKLS